MATMYSERHIEHWIQRKKYSIYSIIQEKEENVYRKR